MRFLETLAVLIGFAVFCAALLNDGRDGPIIGGLVGIAIMESPRWLPCMVARLAKLPAAWRRIAESARDDSFGM